MADNQNSDIQKGTADNEFWIRTEDLAKVKKKIEQYNKSIRKGGTGGWEVRVLDTRDYERKVKKGKEEIIFVVPQTLVRLDGKPPVIEGWEMIGVIDHINGNIVKEVPDQTMPSEFRNADPRRCDHCGVQRRRNESFVFYSQEKDDYIQVGRSCLKDFFTNEGASYFFRTLEWMNEYVAELDQDIEEKEREDFGGWRGTSRISLEVYLAYVAMIISMDKEYISKSASNAYAEKVMQSDDESGRGITPTSEKAIDFMFPQKYLKEKYNNDVPTPSKKDWKIAKQAVEYYLNKLSGKNELSTFEDNLQKLLNESTITWKYLGYVAYVIAEYMRSVGSLNDEMAKAQNDREKAKEIRQQAFEKRQQSEYIKGNIGEQVELEVTVNEVKEMEFQDQYSYHGGTIKKYMFICVTDEGNEVSFYYKSLRDIRDRLDNWDDDDWDVKGTKLKIKGKIKKFGEWKGIKSTTLNYVKLLKIINEDRDMRKRIKMLLEDSMPVSNAYTYASTNKERTLSQWYLVVDTNSQEEFVWTFSDGLSIEKFNSPNVVGVDAFIDEMLIEYNEESLILANDIVYAIEEKEYHELVDDEKNMILNSIMDNVSKVSDQDTEDFNSNCEVYQLYLTNY